MPATPVAIAPIVLKDLVLSTAAYSWQDGVNGVTFTPKTTTVTYKGGTPSSRFSETIVDSWDCKIDYAQDWETANSLAQYLMANAGTDVEFTFAPKAGGQAFTATLNLVPGVLGGTVSQYLTASVTLGVVGAPAPVA